jgi:hypothetical protein
MLNHAIYEVMFVTWHMPHVLARCLWKQHIIIMNSNITQNIM